MCFLLALVLGGMSAVLLYLEIGMVFLAHGGEVTETFDFIVLAVTWSFSTWLFDRGASTVYVVLVRAGVVGILAWLAVVPVTFYVSMVASEGPKDPAASLVAGGILSLIASPIALVCAALALVGLLGHLAFKRKTAPRE